jgi:probable RNA-binding protein EIF1AD
MPPHKSIRQVFESADLPDMSALSVVRCISSRGNRQFEVIDASGEQFLVMMPQRFHKTLWVRPGSFLLVGNAVDESNQAVRGTIEQVPSTSQISALRASEFWPAAFACDDVASESGDSDHFAVCS